MSLYVAFLALPFPPVILSFLLPALYSPARHGDHVRPRVRNNMRDGGQVATKEQMMDIAIAVILLGVPVFFVLGLWLARNDEPVDELREERSERSE